MDELYIGRSGKAIESQPGMAADEYNPVYTVADAEKRELTQESLMNHGYEKGDDLSPVPTAEQGSNVLPNAAGHPSKAALESYALNSRNHAKVPQKQNNKNQNLLT